jgi:16S rRNA (adenine1518-N6/adenine1519-N6)-dimethyltransferase
MNFLPKKSLGQHFLTSHHVLEQIISAAKIKTDKTILEIGPGTGILTAALLQARAKVIAVEKDPRAYELLKIKFSKEIAIGDLNLLLGDILDDKVFRSSSRDSTVSIETASSSAAQYSVLSTKYSIVANIPYYITGAILEKFLEHGPRPDRMILLVQKEVAKRILGRLPGGEGKESVLSISVKAFGTPSIVAAVPRGAFSPPPTVDSAILSIHNIFADRFTAIQPYGPDHDQTEKIRRFFTLVKAGFAHKRKYLKSNLQGVIDAGTLEDIWQKEGLDPKVRAEDIEIETWLKL